MTAPTKSTPLTNDEIQRYNQFAAAHEHLVAKSLFSAGMTWPGVFVFDDQRALDYLASRPDVDATRIVSQHSNIYKGRVATLVAGLLYRISDYPFKKPGAELDDPEIRCRFLDSGAPK